MKKVKALKANEWEKEITQACKTVGTYQTAFIRPIKTLAGILAERDTVYKQYIESGAEPVLEHTNSHGSTNFAKNPLLMLWQDLNTQALHYWRDLGLTPAGLKKINDKAMKDKQKSSFADILKDEFDK